MPHPWHSAWHFLLPLRGSAEAPAHSLTEKGAGQGVAGRKHHRWLLAGCGIHLQGEIETCVKLMLSPIQDPTVIHLAMLNMRAVSLAESLLTAACLKGTLKMAQGVSVSVMSQWGDGLSHHFPVPGSPFYIA